MSIGRANQVFKAAADATRLRLLALLSHGEATVGELQEILGQSQPRVSRHLKLLSDAGLVERFREGHWVYYRRSAGEIAAAVNSVLAAATDPRDPQLAADRNALGEMTRNRQREAWVASTPRRPPEFAAGGRPDQQLLEDSLDDALGAERFEHALLLGCRTGALLAFLAAHADRVSGIDESRSMRLLSRARVQSAGLSNCNVRDGVADALPFEADTFDLAVIDTLPQDGASAALAEISRVLRAGGRLLVLDRIRPVATRLSADAGGLSENQLAAMLAEASCRVTARSWLPGRSLDYALFTAIRGYPHARTGTHV